MYSQVSPPTPNALCIAIKCVRSIHVDLRVHCMNLQCYDNALNSITTIFQL